MVFFSTYATVKNGDFIGNSKVTLRFINSFLGTAERKLTFTNIQLRMRNELNL